MMYTRRSRSSGFDTGAELPREMFPRFVRQRLGRLSSSERGTRALEASFKSRVSNRSIFPTPFLSFLPTTDVKELPWRTSGQIGTD